MGSCSWRLCIWVEVDLGDGVSIRLALVVRFWCGMSWGLFWHIEVRLFLSRVPFTNLDFAGPKPTWITNSGSKILTMWLILTGLFSLHGIGLFSAWCGFAQGSAQSGSLIEILLL